MSSVLWSLPLYDTPCSVCGYPAKGMTVRAADRLVWHHNSATCRMPNPPKDLVSTLDNDLSEGAR